MKRRVGNIFLVWRRSRGERRIIIGKIIHNANKTVFQYDEKGLKEGKEKGFVSYTAFHNTEKIYEQNVLNTFSQRLPKTMRQDLDDFYDFWLVDKTKIDDIWYMLAQTQGMVPIDNFELLADFNPIQGLHFITELAGLSHLKLGANQTNLNKGDELKWKFDKTNPKDKKAIKVFKNDLHIGYVKIVHNKLFHKTKRKVVLSVHHIEKNGTINRVFIEVKLL